MSIQAILLPLFVEVALTLGLMLWMFMARRGDLRSGAVHPSKIALREPNWPRARSRSPTASAINSNCRCCFMC